MKKIYFFSLLILALVLTLTGCQKREYPTYERTLEGESPFIHSGGIMPAFKYSLEYEGNLYAEEAIDITSKEALTEEQAQQVEAAAPGIFCSGHAPNRDLGYEYYSYEFCLSPIPLSGDELFKIVETVKQFDFIHGASAIKQPRIAPMG